MKSLNTRSHRRRAFNSPSATTSRSRDLDPSPAQPSSSAPSHKRNVIPPCDRCRSFKKKCSRTFPTCTLCASASQNCSYSALPATPEAEAVQLRARVQWFSDYIGHHLLGSNGPGIEDIETGVDLASMLGSRLNLDPANLAALQPRGDQDAPTEMPLSDRQLRAQGSLVSGHAESGSSCSGPPSLDIRMDTPSDWGSVECRASYQSSAGTHDPGTNDDIRRGLSTDAAARRFVDTYFRNVDGAYPLVNQAKILENLSTLGDLARRLRDSQSTILYLIMSIGCTSLQRASQVPRRTTKTFDVAYAEIIQECVCNTSIESVQILMLLALYSLFDPAGVSAYSIVSIAARQAILLGLTGRPSREDSCPAAETELCHRLYWSIFALDSMMAVSQGLPAALADNADVPFPSLTVEEFASAERVTYARKLQTSRHVIQLRQLEGRILKHVHFRREAEIAELTPLDRRAILRSLRASTEDWYSKGCLMSPMGGDNTTIHSSTTWLNARYYYLLVLLYYPNHFNSSTGAVLQQDLQQFAQLQLQATSALFQQQELPLNCNTLYRLMPICLVLMHAFVAVCRSANWTTRSTFPFLAKEEVAVALSVLEAFPKEWKLAHQAAQVVRQFAGVISGGMMAFFSANTVFPLATGSRHAGDGSNAAGEACGKETLLILMKPCVARLVTLMQEMMGKSTCFQFIEYIYDETKLADGLPVIPQQSHQRQQATPPTMLRNETDGMQQATTGGHDMIGYGWGALGLEFL